MWSREACGDWLEAHPGTTAPGGRIGRALGPLIKSHSWERLRPAWRAYLSAGGDGPEVFASTWDRWDGGVDRNPRKGPVRDPTPDQIRAMAARLEADGGRVSPEDFVTALVELAVPLRAEVTPLVAAGYWRVLGPHVLSVQHLACAVNRALSESAWMPKPSELMAILEREADVERAKVRALRRPAPHPRDRRTR